MIVGVLGGGQLGRMLALAGHPLGIEVVVLDPAPDACAAPVARHLCGPYDDPALLGELAQVADVVTYEFENVPVATAQALAELGVPVHPTPDALRYGQDRLEENTLFRRLDIDVPDFEPVDSLDALTDAVGRIGLPAVLKTRREGYDGKGQAVLRSADDLAPGWEQIGGVPAIVEAFVPFDREVSVIAARDGGGRTLAYPLSANTHHQGILTRSVSRPGDPVQARAEAYITRLLDHLDYVGVLALELFQVGERLLANEFAPRVHNSGHWTIEGAETSQFENHLRAVAGLDLGLTTPVGRAAMVNCLGTVPPAREVLAVPGAHLHHYGKADRPGRKVGHITVRADDPDQLNARLNALAQLASPDRLLT